MLRQPGLFDSKTIMVFKVVWIVPTTIGVYKGLYHTGQGLPSLNCGYVADANKKMLETFLLKLSLSIKARDNFEDPQAHVTVHAAVQWLNGKVNR